MTKITADMLVGDVLDAHPELAKYFLEIGMHCLGCPMSRGESIRERKPLSVQPFSMPCACSVMPTARMPRAFAAFTTSITRSVVW